MSVETYFTIGAVLATIMGTVSAMNELRLDSFDVFMCFCTLFGWPLVLGAGVLIVLQILAEKVMDWMSRREYCPMTWLFGWPYKLCAFVYGRFDIWRFRRKVRRMIETEDTRVMNEETGAVGEPNEADSGI